MGVPLVPGSLRAVSNDPIYPSTVKSISCCAVYIKYQFFYYLMNDVQLVNKDHQVCFILFTG